MGHIRRPDAQYTGNHIQWLEESAIYRRNLPTQADYKRRIWEYIKSEDGKDKNSLHVYFVREGISDKPANYNNAPRFTEYLALAGGLHDAMLDIAILALFALFFFMASYVSFIRTDVK